MSPVTELPPGQSEKLGWGLSLFMVGLIVFFWRGGSLCLEMVGFGKRGDLEEE